jgi:hypothetical protein
MPAPAVVVTVAVFVPAAPLAVGRSPLEAAVPEEPGVRPPEGTAGLLLALMVAPEPAALEVTLSPPAGMPLAVLAAVQPAALPMPVAATPAPVLPRQKVVTAATVRAATPLPKPAGAVMHTLVLAATVATLKPVMPVASAPPSRPAMVVLAVMAAQPPAVPVVPLPAVLEVRGPAALEVTLSPPAGMPLAAPAALLLIQRLNVTARLGRG